MCECRLFCFGALVVCNVIFVTSFNIDIHNYAIHKGANNSMFGFTVALHRDSAKTPWVLVGAPEAQSRYQDAREITKGGAVYKCEPSRDLNCQEIQFTPTNNKRISNLLIDDQSLQWFGATLRSTGVTNGPVVACAPRYVWFTKDRNRRDPVGTCFVANGGLDSYEEYSPCRTMNWGYHRQGSCQAGFSAAVNKEGDRLYVGSPGAYYWQGQMYSIDAHATFNYTPSYFGYLGFGAKGTVHQQKLEDRPAVFSTREGSPPDDDSYMGYSLVVGHFKENDPNEGIAVGMPRGNKLQGKVLLFTWDLKNYKNITVSQQIGSYFGYSITAADVDGDKRLDIIVGAPMHTEPNNDFKYDVGRVYVFYQTDNEATSFEKYTFIDGKTSKGRFGHSVSTLGDINLDGYADFAVGAPYEGNGAVYIYYGSANGIRKKFGQVIYAEDLHQPNIPKTFGFSLAGGTDLDGNEYPDMAIGSYLSNSAFFFRSRPTVVVDAYVNFLTHRKQIDITQKNCNVGSGNPTNLTNICTAINFCIRYTGKGIPDQMNIELQYILDSKKTNNPRMFFKDNDTHLLSETMNLNKLSEKCRSKEVYLSSEIRDKLTPLEAEVKYYLRDEKYAFARNPQSQIKPVLDLNSPPSRKDSIIIQKDCGDDNICIPDLHVNVTARSNVHTLGTQDDLEFNIIVSNVGEDSFETNFTMKYPKGIEFRKQEISVDSGLSCDTPFNNTITCNVGNPLPRRKIARFKLFFQPPSIPAKGQLAPKYDFEAYVNSANPEDQQTRADNHVQVSINILVESILELRGESHPPILYYNESQYLLKEMNNREGDIGPQLTHVYFLRNGGPSVIEEAEVYILWPLKTLEDEDLLYLLDPPQTRGSVKCDKFQYYQNLQIPPNYKNYKLDLHVDDIWNKLNIDLTNVDSRFFGKVIGNTEVGPGVASGPGVVSTGVNETRYEYTGSHGIMKLNQTGSSSSGRFVVDKYGNVKSSSFEETRFQNAGRPHVSTLGGAQGERRTYGQYGGGQTGGSVGQTNRVSTQSEAQGERRNYGQFGGGQYGTQEGMHFKEESYQVGGGPREGGSQYSTQDRQRPQVASSGQVYNQGGRQQGLGGGEASYEQRRIYSGAGGSQGHSGYGQFSSENQTYRYGSNQQGSGGEHHNYYQQQRPPTEGNIVYQKTYTWESSTSIPIDIPQIPTQSQPLDEVAAGQGYRVEFINMDNTASEINIAGENKGIHDQRSGGYDQQNIYDQSRGGYSQSRDYNSAGGSNSYSGGVGGYGQGESGYHSGSADRDRQTYSQETGGSTRWHSQSGYSRTGQISPYPHNSIERDNVATDRPNPRHRGKRMADSVLDAIQQEDMCGSTKCSYVRCVVGNVNANKEVAILLRSRLNVRAVSNVTSSQSIKLSSMIVGKIIRLPYIGAPREDIIKKHEIYTEIPAKEAEFVSEVAPMWLYVVSAVAGVVMLLLLIWLLSKCGFFKRNRPSSGPERQPLNRNGYHSGDEAL